MLKLVYRSSFPRCFPLVYLFPLLYLSSLYNLAADELSLSCISVLYHCQLKEWRPSLYT